MFAEKVIAEKRFGMYLFRKAFTLLMLSMTLFITSCAGSANQQSTGSYIDDSAISAKVKVAIFNDPTLKSMEITVVTYKGEVQLSGFVSSVANAELAVSIAKKVSGVSSVKNDMRVKDTMNPFYK